MPVHAEAAARIARLSREEGARTLVQLSAIGASANSKSEYAKSKAMGEELAKSEFPDVHILRPSVVFGAECNFFNRFARMAALSPVLPLVGADTRFQPVYVDDVAKAIEVAVAGHEIPAGIYELGGPDVESFRELMQRMLKSVRRRRLIVNLPFFLGRLLGKNLDALQFLTGGILANGILTHDQVLQLGADNIVSQEARTFSDLGIVPVAMEAILDGYLYCYRPYGQYAALAESAKELDGRP